MNTPKKNVNVLKTKSNQGEFPCHEISKVTLEFHVKLL